MIKKILYFLYFLSFANLTFSEEKEVRVNNELINKNELYGYECFEEFYHLTSLEVYEELLKNK